MGLLPPANEVCEGYVFIGVCLSTEGVSVVAGGCMVARGGMHGCSRGACVVAPGGTCVVALGGCAWLLPGGACVVVPRDMRDEGGVMCGEGGVCMVKGACMAKGGMHGKGGVCGEGGRSLRGRYASYWNAFLLAISFRSFVSFKINSLIKDIKVFLFF